MKNKPDDLGYIAVHLLILFGQLNNGSSPSNQWMSMREIFPQVLVVGKHNLNTLVWANGVGQQKLGVNGFLGFVRVKL